jgi:hypothetical protein
MTVRSAMTSTGVTIGRPRSAVHVHVHGPQSTVHSPQSRIPDPGSESCAIVCQRRECARDFSAAPLVASFSGRRGSCCDAGRADRRHGDLPVRGAATRGGAATMYPEFQTVLRTP